MNKEFANVCDWFIVDKLSNHFGEDKTKCILFTRDKNLPELKITYDNNRVKQYHILKYLDFCLDVNFRGEFMVVKSL